MQELEMLIEQYASNKAEYESYKKLCDRENKQIKEIMTENNRNVVSTDNYTAKLTKSVRESFNEEKLLETVKEFGVADRIIKTKEYVDLDELEKAIYNGAVTENELLNIDKCRDKKTVLTLKITNNK